MVPQAPTSEENQNSYYTVGCTRGLSAFINTILMGSVADASLTNIFPPQLALNQLDFTFMDRDAKGYTSDFPRLFLDTVRASKR